MIIPYLLFEGNCEEAIALYTKVFGGKTQHLSRHSEETGGPKLSGKVMHAQVSFGESAICCSDQSEPVRHSEAIRLLVHCGSAAEANAAFEALAAEGQALQPLTPFPPPDDDGMGALVRDKYGYEWILTAPLNS